MSLHIGTTAGAREAIGVHIGTVAGAREVTEGWIGTVAGPRQFYSATPTPPPPPPLSVSVSPDQIYWQVVNPAIFYVSASDATAVVSGGTAPYSYDWTTDNGAASVNNPGAATTGFQSSDGYPANAVCTVTDAEGNVAQSNPVSLI